MNSPLRRIAFACFALFGLLLVQANWVQVIKADDYREDPRNRRVLLRTYDRERGPIVVGDGRQRLALAKSIATEDTLKYLRTYPGGEVYAPVTGFASLVYGNSGIERTQDDVLSGEDDRLFVRRLSDAITGREPKGGAIVLTLNAAAQQAAYDGLAGNVGAVVALDPRTGAVLAMASRPSYDPTGLSSHDPSKIRSTYKSLEANPTSPLANRGVERTYPPGSTFKVVTAAAALANGFTPETRVPSPNVLDLPGTSANLRNFGGGTCGDTRTTTLTDALRISCNTAFGQLGITLGDDKVREQAEKFGFGKDDLLLPQRVAASVYPDEVTKAQEAQSAIGQYNVRATPLQMALVAAGVANGGEVMKPYLVKEVQAPDFSRLDLANPEVYSRAMSGSVADQLTLMMEAVVNDGSATRAQIPNVRVAGKTGTAQHVKGAAPHAWFIGFAPAGDPKVAVAVLIERGGSAGSEATGGRLAAPIAQAVMRAVLGL